MQAYSNPKKANDKWSLADLSIQKMGVATLDCRCGTYTVPYNGEASIPCPSCGQDVSGDYLTPDIGKAWFWAYCFPGCLPDSDWFGPFNSAEQALADARENTDCENDEE